MESEKIRQMFLDAADLRSMGPFEDRRAEVERRFVALKEEYLAEYASSPAADGVETARLRTDWKKVMEYLAGVLHQLDKSMPQFAAANRAVWEVVLPAVQKFYGERPDPENGKN